MPSVKPKLLLRKTQYARRRGVDPSLITRWARDARIVLVDGKVDAEASDALLTRTLDPARGGRGGSPTAAAAIRAAKSVPAVVPVAADDYSHVRTTRESYRAKSEEIEYLERIGTLVEKAAYDRALMDGLGVIQAALASLPARLGPALAAALAAESDVRKVQNLMDDAIALIREDMANTLRQMIPRANGIRQ